MPTQPDDVLDLVASTLRKFRKNRIINLSARLNKYWFFKQFIGKKRVELAEGGQKISEQLKVDHTDARMTAAYDDDVYNTADTMKEISVSFKSLTHNWTVDERIDLLNRGPSAIYKLLDSRETDLIMGQADKMEQQWWSKPADSNDNLNCNGVAYWVVYNATLGFNGGIPSGFSDVGGLNPALYQRHRNFSGQYTTVTTGDLIDKMKQMARLTEFEAPMGLPDAVADPGPDTMYFANDASLRQLETLAEKQNQDLGSDLNKYGDKVTLNRNRIVYCPFLNANAQNPIYQLNFAWFKMWAVEGMFMRKGAPTRLSHKHTVISRHVDTMMNFICCDRSRQGVLALGSF